MKILWLCSWYPHRGSPYEGDFIQRHARALSDFAAISVIYVCQDGPASVVNQDEETVNAFNGSTERVIYFKFTKTGIQILDTIIYNIRYYSVYKREIKRYIATEGKPDLVHVHVPMKAGILGKWVKGKWGIPFIVSEHSSHYNENTDDDFKKRSTRYRLLVKGIFRRADAVTNVSVAIGNRMKELFGLGRVHTIRNTVDTGLFYFKAPVTSRFRFIHVSTLSPFQKNIAGMLGAFKTLSLVRKDFELVIVGPATGALKQKVSDLGLDSFIRFTGEIPYPGVAVQMQEANALVLFSRFENFPCVIIEALCCGLPVITSDTGGTAEAVNSANGIVVEKENEAQLADALVKMMTNFGQYNRKAIAEEAHARYSYNAIGREFYQLYTSTIPKK